MIQLAVKAVILLAALVALGSLVGSSLRRHQHPALYDDVNALVRRKRAEYYPPQRDDEASDPWSHGA